jgi:hypothetical protein
VSGAVEKPPHFRLLTQARAKNKLEKGGKFSSQKNLPSTHHVNAPNHHNFTTKTPHPKRAFSQNTPQKQQ